MILKKLFNSLLFIALLLTTNSIKPSLEFIDASELLDNSWNQIKKFPNISLLIGICSISLCKKIVKKLSQKSIRKMASPELYKYADEEYEKFSKIFRPALNSLNQSTLNQTKALLLFRN